MCDCMTKKRKTCLIILLMLVISWTAVIFMQSAKSGIESTDDTNKLIRIIENIASTIGLEIEVQPHFLRKLAHFLEYAVLGFSAAIFVMGFGKKSLLLAPFGYSVVVALADEFIVQRLAEGRGPGFLDVVIDSAGAATAIFAVLGLWLWHDAIARKKGEPC